SRLLSVKVSSACFGTSSVRVMSPVFFGFQSTEPLVRPMGAMRTSSVTSSPSDVFNETVVTYSRGILLSIVHGIRTDLPTMPNVGPASRFQRCKGLHDDIHPLAQRCPRGFIGQRRDRLMPRRQRRTAAGAERHVTRFHAGRVVPKHDDRGLLNGPILLHPFGLI